jgi:hypothetical protein
MNSTRKKEDLTVGDGRRKLGKCRNTAVDEEAAKPEIILQRKK